MRHLGVYFTLLFCVASCSSIREAAETDLVSEDAIIGAWKCALAQALIKESKPGAVQRLKGRVPKLSLSLKIGDTTNVNASLAAKAAGDGPFVFTLGSGTGSILPSLSAGIQKTNTIQTDIDLRFLLKADNIDVCTHQPKGSEATYRFSSWLANVITGLDKNTGYEPHGVADKIHQLQNFGVTKTGKAGLDIDIVFLDASASADKTRNDVQTIEMTIAAPSKDFPAPDIGNGLGPTLVPKPPTSLGGAAPGPRRKQN